MGSAQAAAEKLIKGEELLRMGDLGRCELVAGRIVHMSPTGGVHGYVESRITRALQEYVDRRGSGFVMSGEVGIYTRRDPDTVRAADVLFISTSRLGGSTPAGFLTVVPELVVEVLSPDDRWSETTRKLKEYFEAGVLVVWIADPEARAIFSYRSLTEISQFDASSILTEEKLLPDFAVPVVDLFPR